MKDEFILNRNGREMVLYAGLLDEAHGKGLRGIDTKLVQIPTPENRNIAVVKATVEMEDGRTFSGIGDASPENVGRNIIPHIIRMAETRSKARALRDATNIGAALLDDESDLGSASVQDVPVSSTAELQRMAQESFPNSAKASAGAKAEPEPTKEHASVIAECRKVWSRMDKALAPKWEEIYQYIAKNESNARAALRDLELRESGVSKGVPVREGSPD